MKGDRDTERFEELYRGTRVDLLRYLVRRTTTREEAADMLAETYLVAWERLDRVPAGPQARLWLFGVARNLALRGHRRRRLAVALLDRLVLELRSVETATAGKPHDEALWAALAELSEIDREIVTLTAWEGLSPQEIAIVLGISTNATRIRLHRARKRLQGLLASGPAASSTPGAAYC